MGVVSQLREGMDQQTDAILTLASAICQLAASHHARDYGDQRNMGAVFFADAQNQFADLTGRITLEQTQAINDYITALCSKAPKK